MTMRRMYIGGLSLVAFSVVALAYPGHKQRQYQKTKTEMEDYLRKTQKKQEEP